MDEHVHASITVSIWEDTLYLAANLCERLRLYSHSSVHYFMYRTHTYMYLLTYIHT